MEGSIEESIDKVLVGIGREVDDDGEDSSAEAYFISFSIKVFRGDIPQLDVHLYENYIPIS